MIGNLAVTKYLVLTPQAKTYELNKATKLPDDYGKGSCIRFN